MFILKSCVQPFYVFYHGGKSNFIHRGCEHLQSATKEPFSYSDITVYSHIPRHFFGGEDGEIIQKEKKSIKVYIKTHFSGIKFLRLIIDEAFGFVEAV